MEGPSLLRLPEVLRRVGLKKSSVYDYIQRGWFPRPVPLGVRMVAWNSADIDAWIANRLAAGLEHGGARK